MPRLTKSLYETLYHSKKENTLCQALSYSSLYTRELFAILLFSHVALNPEPLKAQYHSHYIKHYSFFKFTAGSKDASQQSHNYSLFIIHYTKSPPSFQTTDLDIKF